MKQIYTNENRMLAMNSKNLLENAGIEVLLKNEHSSGSNTGFTQVWLELWVNDADYQQASEVLDTSKNNSSENWVCNKCDEENGGAFEVCWNCQSESP